MSRTVMAHIEKVIQTYPIEGADKIEMVQILDFHVVTKKGEFKSGDLAVYVEVDSILPDGLPVELQTELESLKKQLKTATGEDIKKIEDQISEICSKNTRPEFEFLRQKKFRIKCQKYSRFADKFGNPIISQGILFPLSIIPEDFLDRNEGVDVTSLLGVQKVVEDEEEIKESVEEKTSTFEKFLDKKLMRFSIYRTLKKEIRGKKISGNWLDIFPPQSDEVAAQKVYSKILEKHGREGWYVSEKMEGQNLSTYLLNTKHFFGLKTKSSFGVCTHHRHLPVDDGSQFWKTAKLYNFEKRLKSIGKNLFLRSEHLGGRIQGNIYNFLGHHIHLFEVYDMDNKRLYNFDEFMEFCLKYEFEHVPILDDNFTLPENVSDILNYSNGYSVFGDKVLREGVVIRKKDNPTISFKVRSPEYLLKWGK